MSECRWGEWVSVWVCGSVCNSMYIFEAQHVRSVSASLSAPIFTLFTKQQNIHNFILLCAICVCARARSQLVRSFVRSLCICNTVAGCWQRRHRCAIDMLCFDKAWICVAIKQRGCGVANVPCAQFHKKQHLGISFYSKFFFFVCASCELRVSVCVVAVVGLQQIRVIELIERCQRLRQKEKYATAAAAAAAQQQPEIE